MTTDEAIRAILTLSREAFDQGVYAATLGSNDAQTLNAREAREAAETALIEFVQATA